MVVAFFQDNLRHFVRETPVERGVEYVSSLDLAKQFADEAEALAYVGARRETRPVQVMAV